MCIGGQILRYALLDTTYEASVLCKNMRLNSQADKSLVDLGNSNQRGMTSLRESLGSQHNDALDASERVLSEPEALLTALRNFLIEHFPCDMRCWSLDPAITLR